MTAKRPNAAHSSRPTATRRPPRRRRRTLITTALAAVALAGAAEASARIWLDSALSGATASMLGGHASVGIGGRPALIDLAAGSVPTLTVHAADVDVCKIHGATIDATFHDARRQQGRLAVASSQASILLPPASIATLLNARLGAGMTATVLPIPSTGELDVRLGALLDLHEQPALKNGALTFTPTSVGIGGIGGFASPAGLAGALATKTAFSQKLPNLPLAMHAQTLSVTPDGLLLAASGPAAASQPAKAVPPSAGLRSC